VEPAFDLLRAVYTTMLYIIAVERERRGQGGIVPWEEEVLECFKHYFGIKASRFE